MSRLEACVHMKNKEMVKGALTHPVISSALVKAFAKTFSNILPEVQETFMDIFGQLATTSDILDSYEPRHDKTCLRDFPTRPDTNRPVQPQKLARVLKVWL